MPVGGSCGRFEAPTASFGGVMLRNPHLTSPKGRGIPLVLAGAGGSME